MAGAYDKGLFEAAQVVNCAGAWAAGLAALAGEGCSHCRLMHRCWQLLIADQPSCRR